MRGNTSCHGSTANNHSVLVFFSYVCKSKTNFLRNFSRFFACAPSFLLSFERIVRTTMASCRRVRNMCLLTKAYTVFYFSSVTPLCDGWKVVLVKDAECHSLHRRQRPLSSPQHRRAKCGKKQLECL